MKVALNIDDFSVVHNRLELFLKLREHFPNFKVSMFMIPVDKRMDWGAYRNRKFFLEEIKKNLDWIQIIPHAYKHEGREMESMSYETFKVVLTRIKEAFEADGLPYEKGFKSPHWKQSAGVVKALDEIGWWSAVLSDNFPPMPTTKRFYKFTHLLNEPFWESDLPVLKLHGHIYGTKNDIGLCLDNLLKLPKETDFHFITDYLETA